jgi:MYXO-CTERM domain-containing protein
MKFLLSIAVLIGLASSALRADALADPCPTTSTSGIVTLARYIPVPGSSFTCSVGILNFAFNSSSFQSFATAGTPSLLTASQIEVTTEPNGLSGGFSFGTIPGSAFAVGAGQSALYDLEWLMVIDAGPVGAGANIDMDPPFGTVSITQKYCADGTTDGPDFCSTGFQSLMVSSPPCTTNPIIDPAGCSSSLTFSPPIRSFAEVLTSIALTGGTTGAGFDSTTGTAIIVDPTAAPEPASFLLGLGGLVLAGSLRRRRAV